LEAITRLVADSLARHGLDRPVDPRRLQWSRWFRCDSTHSLLVVPSKPGIFAIAEEVMDFGTGNALVGPGLRPGQAEQSSATPEPRRMLAVLQFSEDDDMAFTLDRMFTCVNPMRARLATGRCFLRFVVIEDQAQRRSICNALNQWMLSSAEKASGLPADFSSSLELSSADETNRVDTDRVGRTLLSAKANTITPSVQAVPSVATRNFAPAVPEGAHLDSGAAKNLHCPESLPSGF
jgi:hypothetical protein